VGVGLGVVGGGVWGLGLPPKPPTPHPPIPNPQSPIPIEMKNENIYFKLKKLNEMKILIIFL